MNPLITVSIPVYNVEKYVEKSLLSALNQTYDNLEILIVDDKGTDRSMEVVQRVIASHPRGNAVKIIDHGKNQGTGATKNSAIDNARGEYLFFMDSDDEITEDCVEVLYSAMKETPVDFVAGSIDEVDDDGNLVLKRQYIAAHYISNNDIIHSQYDPEWIKSGKSSCLIAPTWNRLYNLDFLKRSNIRCIPYQRNEDLIFTFQLFLFAESCRILSVPTYRYNVARPGSTMDIARKGYTDYRLKQDMDVVEFYCSYIDYIKNNKPETSKYILSKIEARAALTKYCASHLGIRRPTGKTLRQLTEKIGLHNLLTSFAAWYFWTYLHAPSLFLPLLDSIYFKRKKHI